MTALAATGRRGVGARPLRPLTPHPTLPGVLIVTLTRGRVALIDGADAPLAAPWDWHYGGTGYAARGIVNPDGTRGVLYLHRVILGLTGNILTDHVNRDKLDNRRQNLRPATRAQNAANSAQRGRFRGVRFDSRNRLRPWCGQFNRTDGGCSFLGNFTTPEDAARAYDAAAREAYGDFAALNFPDQAERTNGHAEPARAVEASA